jgi:hypothetical protein
MFKKLLNSALSLISKEPNGKFDVNLVRITCDDQTLHPRVEATDLIRIIRVEDTQSRMAGKEFFLDHRVIPTLAGANTQHSGNVLCAVRDGETLMIETKDKANWPDFDRVLPTKPSTQRIELRGDLLVELLQAVLAFKASEKDVISLELHRGELVVKAAGNELSVVAMQSRIKD